MTKVKLERSQEKLEQVQSLSSISKKLPQGSFLSNYKEKKDVQFESKRKEV